MQGLQVTFPARLQNSNSQKKNIVTDLCSYCLSSHQFSLLSARFGVGDHVWDCRRKSFLIDWLIDYLLFYVPRKNFSLIWRRHHCRWRLQNLGSRPLSSLEGSLSCHTCCDTGPRFFRSHPKDHPNQSLLTTLMGMRRTYSNPDPHGVEEWTQQNKHLRWFEDVHVKYLWISCIPQRHTELYGYAYIVVRAIWTLYIGLGSSVRTSECKFDSMSSHQFSPLSHTTYFKNIIRINGLRENRIW
jgi:hypothetical protein